MIGEYNEADAEAVEQSFVDSLRSETVTTEEEDKGLPTWAIVLIVVGSVLVVAAAVTIPLVLNAKKKKAKAEKDEATVNAYKKKIDTTDDKSIDVYADDEAEETAEDAVEEAEVAEETTETAEAAPETEETAEEEVVAEEEKKEE